MDYQDQARFGMNEPDEPDEYLSCWRCPWEGTWEEAENVGGLDDDGRLLLAGYVCPRCGAELDEE